MKRTVILLMALLNAGMVMPQMADTLRLEDCFSRAAIQFNGSRMSGPLTEAAACKLRNYNTRWLPVLNLTGQATYQSETVQMRSYDPVTGQPFTIDLPLDQYKIQVEISQQLFDGGVTRVQKDLERNALGIEQQQIEVDLKGFRQMINQFYFSVMLAEKSSEVLYAAVEELRVRKMTIESLVNNGMLIQEDLDAIVAEELTIEQKMADVRHLRAALLHHISLLLDTAIAENTHFKLPEIRESGNDSVRRPEYEIFSLQKQQLAKNRQLLTAIDLPKVSAFSQLGYGRPGFDFLNEDLHDYYLIGIGLKWNFLRYGETGRQKKILQLQKEIIDIKRDSFDENLAVQLENERQNIGKYKEMIEKDKQITVLRKSVTRSSFAKLENGTITPTDFLSNTNAEIQAKLQLENHEIMLLQSIYNYLLIKGDI